MGREPGPPGTATLRRVPDGLRFAHGLLRQRKFDLAAEEYDRFLATGPTGLDRLDARFGLANARLYQGRYAEARRAFEEFLKGAPDDPRARTARYRLGELSYLTGDLPAARRALEAFTAAGGAHPGLETAWTYLGDVCFGLKDLPAARLAYERSLSTYPRGRLAARARYGLGRTLAGQGERDRALEMLRELARDGGPGWVDRAWLEIGAIESSAGRFAEVVEAMAALERAAPRSALRPEARYRRAGALVQLGRRDEGSALLRSLADDPGEPLGAQAALELATIELERQRPEAALAALDAALKRFPQSPIAPALHFRAAEALGRLNRPAEAEARFLQAVEADPQAPWADEAYRRAARSALDRGEPAMARRLAGQFAARFPRSPLRAEIRLTEGRAAAAVGDHRLAADVLESLLGVGPDRASAAGSAASPAPVVAQEARYELALAYRALGRPDEAEAILARLAQGPSGPIAADARFLLGQAHVEAGRYAQALAPLGQYLSANPRGEVAAMALAHLAVAQLGAGRADDAWKTLALLAERFPRHKALAPARLRFAEAALAAHQPDRAVEQFRLVAGVGPSTNQPLMVQASRLQTGYAGGTPAPQTRGDPAPDSSAATLDPALRVRALAGLGRALRDLGQPGEAASAFAEALELAPGDPMAAELALARGRALEAANQPDRALEAYALAAHRWAKSEAGPRASLARARLLTKLGRHAEAALAFERLIADSTARESLAKAGTGVGALLAEWGWSLVDAAKPSEADVVFARLLKEVPESPYAADARFNLAESANLAHNYAEVIRLLTPLANGKPTDARKDGTSREARSPAEPDPRPEPSTTKRPDEPAPRRLLPAVLYRLGRTRAQLQDWAGAATSLDRLLAEFPDNPYRREARFLRSEAALRSGDAAAAEAGIAALRAGPADRNDPPEFPRILRLKQVQCWVALKRWKDVMAAVPSLRSELAAGDPALAELDYARGQALLGLGRLDDARAAFQAVIDARRGDELAAQAQLMCGETFFHQDRLHEALREFLKVDVLHAAPRWQAAALLEAGKVYERLDQWADAAETYEGLLARFADDPDAVAARARLDAARRRASAQSANPHRPDSVPKADPSPPEGPRAKH
jgi:TolA-binding protein